jgi:putative aminopeptidase FrvX
VQQDSIEFLKKLLDTPAPSGFEAAAARIWRDEAQGRLPTASTADVSGNSIADAQRLTRRPA